MACIDFPSAEHEDATESLISPRTDAVVIPTPPLALRHEQEHPFEEDLTPDAEGHVRFALPVFVRVEVFPRQDDTECFLIATLNKRSFGRGGDGLTIYGSVNRTDFTFRTSVFDGHPDVIRHNHVKLRRGEWNEMGLAIGEHQATYWINRVPVATCILEEGDLPSNALFFGLTCYAHDYQFRRFDVSRDPTALSVFNDRVLTLQGTIENGTLRVRCLNMSGSEVATFDATDATELLPGTEVVALRELRAHPCEEHGETDIFDSTVTVRLQPGGCVRRTYDNGSVSLQVPESLACELRNKQPPLRCYCSRRRGGASTCGKRGYLYLPVGEPAALQAQGGQRLGEFRAKAAAALGILEHNLKLAMPDGTFLPKSQDAQALQTLLQPSLA